MNDTLAIEKEQQNGTTVPATPLKPLWKLDMGCGQRKTEGFTGVDIYPCAGVDVVHDLRKIPYPFEDNSVGEIFSSHFVEHLTGEEFMAFMDECHRILVMGGKMRLIHPYCFSARAFQDPTHKTFIPAERYQYFDANWRKVNGLDHYNIKSDYQYNVYLTYHNDKGQRWDLKMPEAMQFPMSHYVNVVADLIVDLIKR